MKNKNYYSIQKGAIKTIFTFLIILMNSYQVEALKVNSVTGSLVHDIKLHPLLNVSYKSKSVSQGIFGESRCSELDYKVVSISESLIVIDACFTFLKLYKLNNSKAEFFTRDLTFRLKTSNKLTTLVTPSNKTLLFDSKGDLIRVSDSKSFLLIKRNKRGLKLSSFGRQIQVKVNRERQITSIKIKDQKYTFRYNLNKLTTITRNNRLAYSYKYDKFSNLIEYIGQNLYKTRITYNQKYDRVKSISNPRCYSLIEYQATSANSHQSTILTKCSNQRTKGVQTTITLNRFNSIKTVSIAKLDLTFDRYQPTKNYVFDGYQRLLSSKDNQNIHPNPIIKKEG